MYTDLYHWGILGMKWGVRRTERQLARIRGKAEKEGWSDDAKTAAETKTKNVSQMSNAELRKLNERMRLEQEFESLTAKQKSAGRKFVEDVVKESGKEIAKGYVTKYAKKGLEALGLKVKSKFDFSDVGKGLSDTQFED